MSPLDTMERWLRPVAMPYLAAVIAGAQMVMWLWVLISAPSTPGALLDPITLVPSQVMAGEWWRLLTFLAVPPNVHPLWLALMWLCLVAIGSELERGWGTARFNLYLLIGWLATCAAAFARPDQSTTNGFILLSVFLAYATLFPEATFRLFLIIPVKAKWMALFTWIVLGIGFVLGDGAAKLAILASVANWSAFFLPMVIRRTRSRTVQAARRAVPKKREPFHRCVVCGKNDLSHPELEFRYCDKCEGAPGYCLEHLATHQHIRREAPLHTP
ncbi:MAG: rhomboid family intramembrane serine protease [Phycisphaeraceae bacterium]|nr:rhomboid family intramembrane serine protease [Phycisphaeraceae bacterium]